MEEMDDILKEFITETVEGLENIDQDLITYEKTPEDRPLLDKIFRNIHTIKGGSGFLSLGKVESIAHYSENILSKIRDGKFTLNSTIMNVILEAIDALKDIIGIIETTGNEGDKDYKSLIVKLKEIVEGGDAASVPEPVEPALEISVDSVEKEVPEVKSKTEEPEKSEKQEEIAVEKAPEPVEIAPVVSEQKPQAKPPAGKPGALSSKESNIRVQVELLDKLMNLVGELVLSRNQIVQSSLTINDTTLNTVTQGLSMITTELQETMMKTRMQPVGNVFNKFPRIVRDLAQSFNKEIALKIKGEDTELDRAILEGITDPLTHIIRNSIDHGIETAAERTAKGKSPSGSLLIQAYHEGGNVIVEIVDDGAGIDPEKIKKKAAEKGILLQNELDLMGKRDLINLVFHPGFSTAEKVTNVSGRGVGMDVVKTNSEKIGGSIDIQSEVDQGTSIKLKIPLTLAIVQALIVCVDKQRFAIPQVNLIELVRLEGDAQIGQIEDVHGMQVYRLREKLLPLVGLKNVLGLLDNEKEIPPDEDRIVNIVVLAAGETQFGLIVDEILDTEEIVVKPVSKHLKSINSYSGATIMGDGKAVLILDVLGLARAYEMEIESSGRKLAIAGDNYSLESTEINEFLIFSLVPNEQLAIPIQLVSRIEKISPDRIETFGDTEVLQYYGKLLPVIRIEDYLNISRPESEREEVFVVVLQMEKDIGFIVSDIIDTIDAGTDVDTKTVIQEGILGTTLFNKHTTLIIDTYKVIEKAHPEWFKKERMDSDLNFNKEDITILLAEDSPFFQNMERSYLESAGYKVISANNGIEALEKLASHTIHILITDIEMPGMNGFDLAKKVREDSNYKDMPILAVTSLIGDDERKRSKEVGIDEYLVKLNKDELLKGIDKIMSIKSKKDAGSDGSENDAEVEISKRASFDRRDRITGDHRGSDNRNKVDRRADNNFLVATFYIGNEFCGIDALQVQEILRYHEVTTIPLSTPDIKGLINLRGRILTVIDTRYKLNIDESLWNKEPMSLVVYTDEDPVSLLVDDVGDIMELEKRLFEPPPKTFKGFDAKFISGIFKLDGRLLMMLNSKTLLGIDSENN